MFNKLKRRIFNSIFFVVLAFVFLTTAISYATITNFIFTSQKTRTEKNVEAGVLGCTTYLETVMSFVCNTAEKKEVVSATQGSTTAYAVQRLDDLCNLPLQVDGVVLYNLSAPVCYSAGVGDVPSFAELSALDEVKQFLLSDEQTLLSVRTKAICRVYNKSRYDVQKGIVSCFCKVYNSQGNVSGLLEADILPQTLVNAKLQKSSFDANGTAYLLCDGSLLSAPDGITKYVSQKDGITNDGKYYKTTFQRGKLLAVLFVPFDNFVKQTFAMACVFVALAVVLVCMGAIVAYIVRGSIGRPLDRLLERMESQGVN